MPGQGSVYRKVSLDRLSSPEQLDQKLTVVSPAGWAALASFTVLLAAALLWGFLGSVSDKVSGGGMLLYGQGVVALTSNTGGQVTDVSVREGDHVERGQVIARVSQEDLLRQIERHREALAALNAISPETLDLDIHSLNREQYAEFSQIAGQIRLARVQYEAQKEEAQRNERDVADRHALQAQQVKMLEEQIDGLEKQIAQYKELLEHQREVELENAEAYDRQRAQQVTGGALYTSDRGESFRRNSRAMHQLAVMDQVGVTYIILSDNTDDESYPVFYMDRYDGEIYNSDGRFYLPNYFGSVFGGDFDDIPRRGSTRTVYFENMTGTRYIDLTGREFRPITGDEVPSTYDQLQTRPEYDPSLAQMEAQLESYRLQLIQARMQESQIGSTFTSFLWGGYNQTGEQISSLMEQFSHLKQITEQDLLKELQDMQFRLSQRGVITASYSGNIAGLSIQLDQYVQPGSVLGNIVRDDDGASSVILYVPIEHGKQITVGMEVDIFPTTVNREEHGYIIGRVRAVSVYAVSQERMMSTLQNQQLVQAFGGQSAVIEVEAELLRNAETVSGYEWSTPKGAPFQIAAGTICIGEVRVSSKRPVDMVVPFLRRLIGSV
ncbi:MAG: NHLP bacteriocin system secretion protein [Oscillospiraceae bacterium]|nr:NHLP bacteriocin system secretion protein [Oscillospiraceae bacterium]